MIIIKSLFFLLLVILPFGQLTRLPIGNGEINVYLQDLVIAGLIISWLVWHKFAGVSFARPPLARLILLFFGLAFLSWLINFNRYGVRENLIAGLYLWRWIFYAGIYFVVYDVLIYHIEWKRKMLWGLVGAGVVSAVLGLAQYFLYPDLRNLAYLGFDPHKFRAFGTFFDPNFLGIILALTLILIVAHWEAWGNWGNWGKKLISTGAILVYLALALTYSRSSYLAYLSAMAMIAWFKRSPNFFLTVLLTGILTIIILPRPHGSIGVDLGREESFRARVVNWQQSLSIAKDNLVFGVGFNNYRYAQERHGFLNAAGSQVSHAGAGADSSLLFVLATTGIIGFSSYLYMTYMIYKTHKKDKVILASLGAILSHSFFNNSLFYPWVMIWLWIIIGINKTDKSDKSNRFMENK